MTDLAITITNGAFDLSITDRDLTVSEGFSNAIFISLLTDIRADDDDKLPFNSTDRRGWWGDAFATEINGIVRPTGSKLWLLARAKLTTETLDRIRDYSKDALKWMIDDGLVSAVNVAVTRQNPAAAIVEISITEPTGQVYKYKILWSEIDGLATQIIE